jgi:hypothetical protein
MLPWNLFYFTSLVLKRQMVYGGTIGQITGARNITFGLNPDGNTYYNYDQGKIINIETFIHHFL